MAKTRNSRGLNQILALAGERPWLPVPNTAEAIMTDTELVSLRTKIDDINHQLLELLNQRATVALAVAKRKSALGISGFDPERESSMLTELSASNSGPFSDTSIQSIFKNIFRATLELMDQYDRQELLVSRQSRTINTVIEVNGCKFGKDTGIVVAGPCAVENPEQIEAIAEHLAKRGVKVMRGGAYKPRTSPYAFQGLGLKGLKMLHQAAKKHGLAVVTEFVDSRDLAEGAQYADIIQIGARNMYNYALLKEVGHMQVPVLLKRSFGATLEELLLSAEYILSCGNPNVILCERGIRSFEHWTRNTLDISAVPLLKQESHLPVMVDISHAAGRRDILLPLARAAFGAGADALMVEVHSKPTIALSDSQQQLSLPEFDDLLRGLGHTW